MVVEARNTVPARVLLVGLFLCGALVWGGLVWRDMLVEGKVPNLDPNAQGVARWLPTLHPPVIELLKLIAAFGLGAFLTTVHRYTSRAVRLDASMEHAQILLCVAGALVMIIVGDSLARAFGIVGAASVIRFRTPIDNPKDTIILFLLMAIGMAAGLGAFAVAAFGAAFLCAVMIVLARAEPKTTRMLLLAIASTGPDFPSAHVIDVLSRRGIQAETRGLTEGAETIARYRVAVPEDQSLDEISAEIREHGGSIRSVVWEKAKKSE
jgi:hypothetical protein